MSPTATATPACTSISPDGKLLMSWGEPGTDPGQFNIVHNICTDAEGWVYVADRENHRVQVFDGNGKYETQWNNLHRPCALCCCGGKHADLHHRRAGSGHGGQPQRPQPRPRLSIVDAKGKLIARLGGEKGPGWRPASSSRRTASRWIRRATSTSARSASPTGRPAFRIRRCRRRFGSPAACRSSKNSSTYFKTRRTSAYRLRSFSRAVSPIAIMPSRWLRCVSEYLAST